MDSIVNIRLVVMGVIPKEFKIRKIMKWKSQLFAVQGGAHYSMSGIQPDLTNYEYSDNIFRKGFPNTDQTAQQSVDRNKTDLTIYLVDAIMVLFIGYILILWHTCWFLL